MKRKSLIIFILVFAAMQLMAQDFKFWMSNPTLTADGQTVTYLHIYQTDANNKQYWNFQVEITMPEGIHIAKKKVGRDYVNDATLNEDRFEGLPHVLGVNMPDATTFKSLCGNSASKQPYYNDNAEGEPVEELFRVGLVADPEMKNGEYTITMYKAILVDTDVKDFRITEPVTATMTITGGQGSENDIMYTLTDAGCGTLILPFEAALPEGVEAFTCTGLDGNTVLTERQENIPANTPVLLTGTPGSYTFSGTGTATETAYTTGLLTGVLQATTIDDGYVLQQQNGVPGFYVVDGNNPKTIPANRCYLSVPSGVQVMRVDFGKATGLRPVSQLSPQGRAYDLSGRPADKDAKGIIIVNNQKLIR